MLGDGDCRTKSEDVYGLQSRMALDFSGGRLEKPIYKGDRPISCRSESIDFRAKNKS